MRVLGCGSWGTALSVILAWNGNDVTLAGRDGEEIASLRSFRENLRYLPGFMLPSEVTCVLLGELGDECDLTAIAVPAGASREMFRSYCTPGVPVVICSKGLEAVTSELLTEVAAEVLSDTPVGVLSGPNLAIEVVQGVPTVAVSAFREPEVATLVQRAFNCSTFRVSVSTDVVGIELAGALKNVLAIGAGMSDGLGFGDNTKGAFLSRGLMEMARLGAAMGAAPDTFLGPAGVGDLFATANSTLSRNYRVGYALGLGKSLREVLDEIGQVAEGVPTSEAVQALAKRFGVSMPVFQAVDAVVRNRLAPHQAVAMLMESAPRSLV